MASLNRPVRQKTVVTGGFEIYINKASERQNRVRMGLFKEQELGFGGETQEDQYTNFFTKKVVQGDRVSFGFSYHEMRPEIIEIINGGGSIRRTADGLTLFAGEEFVLDFGTWKLDQYFALSLRNGDNTLVTINSITGSVDGPFAFGALTQGTDYDIILDPINGDTLLVLITGGSFTTEDQRIVVDYDVTPAKGDYMTELASYIPTPFECLIRWVGTDSATGEQMVIEIEMENTTNDKNFPGLIGDKDESTAGLPCAFSGFVKENGYRFLNFQS